MKGVKSYTIDKLSINFVNRIGKIQENQNDAHENVKKQYIKKNSRVINKLSKFVNRAQGDNYDKRIRH